MIILTQAMKHRKKENETLKIKYLTSKTTKKRSLTDVILSLCSKLNTQQNARSTIHFSIEHCCRHKPVKSTTCFQPGEIGYSECVAIGLKQNRKERWKP